MHAKATMNMYLVAHQRRCERGELWPLTAFWIACSLYKILGKGGLHDFCPNTPGNPQQLLAQCSSIVLTQNVSRALCISSWNFFREGSRGFPDADSKNHEENPPIIL